jgi:hypothetical protein
MKRINVMISDEAKEELLLFQKEKKLTTLDEAVDQYILSQK